MRGELAAIAKLAYPIALAQIGLMTLALVDTAIVGRTSVDDLAGAALDFASRDGTSAWRFLDREIVPANDIYRSSILGAVEGVDGGFVLATFNTRLDPHGKEETLPYLLTVDARATRTSKVQILGLPKLFNGARPYGSTKRIDGEGIVITMPSKDGPIVFAVDLAGKALWSRILPAEFLDVFELVPVPDGYLIVGGALAQPKLAKVALDGTLQWTGELPPLSCPFDSYAVHNVAGATEITLGGKTGELAQQKLCLVRLDEAGNKLWSYVE